MKRQRKLYAVVIVVVIVLGLLSRRFPNALPAMLGKYPGDALWALMIFFGIGFLFPRLASVRVAGSALAFSGAVEFSQLYQAPWIEAWRETLAGRLILGRGFAWNDLAAYAVGVFIAWVLERLWEKFLTTKKISA